jgi:hypothetical protein
MIERMKTAAQYSTGLLLYRLKLCGSVPNLPLSAQNWCAVGLWLYGNHHKEIAREVSEIVTALVHPAEDYTR